MDQKLLYRYRKYANTEKSFAVLFVKKHLNKAKGHWVDIDECDRYYMSRDELHFRFVNGGLYKRKIQPNYPPKSEFTKNGVFDELNYYLMIRAITWETAHKDIQQQKSQKMKPLNFSISGVSYEKERDSSNYFRDDAPAEVKLLANNLRDRTNPLWDIAMKYINEPEFIYEIRKVRVYR